MAGGDGWRRICVSGGAGEEEGDFEGESDGEGVASDCEGAEEGALTETESTM